jgi:hypothetical protein
VVCVVKLFMELVMECHKLVFCDQIDISPVISLTYLVQYAMPLALNTPQHTHARTILTRGFTSHRGKSLLLT